ncbi:hypothetical protein [Stappia sp.]|uniref:hypothetical protein n=1 Tax=Stappia sp. TaxID=1870903 RepID=UPI003A9958FA
MSARILANSQRSITCIHAGWRAGLVPASLLAFAALSILAGGLARADPVGEGCVPVVSAVSTGDIVLASLGAGEAVTAGPITGRRIVPDFDGTADATIKVRPIVVAGRCGSSQSRCDSPGFTYCCGNSTDGFYCAADVNGCTK